MKQKFRYTVVGRERGDYIDPPGPEETFYKGPSAVDAFLEAQKAASRRLVVTVSVECAGPEGSER